MRYLIIILLLSSCTAQWHLQKAIEKEQDIIDVQADTTLRVNISYKDTAIFLQRAAKFEFISDTGRVDTLIKKDSILPDFGPLNISSYDSIAHAKAWIKDQRLWLETWATVDTSKIIQDTVQIKQKIIDSLKVINTQKEATIRKKESWIKSVQRWAVIGGIIIFVVALVILIKKL